MQDMAVAICVIGALYFVVRTLWRKTNAQKEGGGSGCAGCSGCAKRSPLRDGMCSGGEGLNSKPAPAADKP